MDERAALILKRAQALHRNSPLSALEWNEAASTQREIAGMQISSLNAEQRAGFLKHAEDRLLEEGAIKHVDQS
jgi:hypothetical protein